MRITPSHVIASAILLGLSAPLLAIMPHIHRGPTSPKGVHRHAVRVSAHSHKHSSPAPAGMASERATQIQTALIKNGYMSGEPTGTWDSTSQAAMVKMQGDNGWQTRLVPDSRALIKLGLGPGSTPAPDSSEVSASVAGNQ